MAGMQQLLSHPTAVAAALQNPEKPIFKNLATYCWFRPLHHGYKSPHSLTCASMCSAVRIYLFIVTDVIPATCYLAVGSALWAVVAATYTWEYLLQLPARWLGRRTAWLWQPVCIAAIRAVDVVPWRSLRIHMASAGHHGWALITCGAGSVAASARGANLFAVFCRELPPCLALALLAFAWT